MGATGKSARDGLVSGGLGGLVTGLLVAHHMDPVEAAVVGAFAVGVVTRTLRYLRGTRWAGVINILYPDEQATE